jgi:predicted Fe-S protein YdhL (DUF1289 family)
MTEPHPQEYIITEEQVKIMSEPGRGLRWLAVRIRSRPHLAPAASPICDRCKTGQEPFCIGCERLKPHDAAIAKSAREQVLSLLEEWDYYNNRNFGKPHPVFADMIRMVREKPEDVRKHLESLRAQQEHPKEEP